MKKEVAIALSAKLAAKNAQQNAADYAVWMHQEVAAMAVRYAEILSVAYAAEENAKAKVPHDLHRWDGCRWVLKEEHSEWAVLF